MVQRIPERMIVLVAVVSLGVAGLAPAGADDRAGPKVVAAVQVTTDTNPVRAHSSPQMAMNPTNGELVIVSSEVRADFGCLVHLSTDGGRTWSQGGVPMLEPWTECSRKTINGPYATAAFDRAGVLYVAFYASDPKYAAAEELPIHIFLARSSDGGRTFETDFVYRAPEPVAENQGLHNNDRPMVAVDQQNPENVYVSWMGRGAKGQKGTKALVAASSDGGRTFREPVDVTDERGGYQARPAVTPDGTLHVIYPIGLDARPEEVEAMEVVRTVYHRASTDNGSTWSTPVEVDEGNAGFFGGRKYLLVAGQEDDALHAVWSASEVPVFDPTSRTSTSSCAPPGTAARPGATGSRSTTTPTATSSTTTTRASRSPPAGGSTSPGTTSATAPIPSVSRPRSPLRSTTTAIRTSTTPGRPTGDAASPPTFG